MNDNRLMYAYWNGSDWQKMAVDTDGNGNYNTSLGLDGDGNPHISYTTYSSDELRYAHWTGSSWEIDTLADDAEDSSLAVDGSGRPHIAYCYDDKLTYAVKSNDVWDITFLDETLYECEAVSLALDQSGDPHIIYANVHAINEETKYAYWSGSAWMIEPVFDHEVDSASLALDQYGNPRFSYYYQTSLHYAAWSGQGWNSETLSGGGNNTLALSGNGTPYISYIRAWAIELAYLDDGDWITQTIADLGEGSSYTYHSLALDSNGNVHISYYDYFTKDLLYAYHDSYQPGGGSFLNFLPLITH
jgi:hypothetical protein